MAKKKYEEANIQAIGTAIREKTGTEKTYKTKDMASGVGEVYNAGYSVGEEQGYDRGKNEGRGEGYEEGYREGKQAEYDAFWDSITNSGTRKDLDYAFRNWSTPYIRPSRKISVTQRSIYVFCRNKKLKKIEGKYFDFSGWTPSLSVGTQSHYETFSYCDELEEIEDIGMQAGGYYDVYRNCPKLHTISVMRVTEDCTFSNNNFHACRSLANLTIEGTLGTNFNVSWSPLSVASLKNIIKHLKNYSGTEDHVYTLTVKASAWEALEAEGLNDEDKAWLISLMPYVEEDIDYVTWATVVDFFSWNLVLVA